MYSSYTNKPINNNKLPITKNQNIRQNILPVFVGEVSLLGEVRKVKFWEKRKKEAEAMGRKLVEIRNVREIK